MKGTLYRYPHPFDSSRFLYVGQGPKRDKRHRLGKEGFGRRFIKLFPNTELPQPILEEVEVKDQLELNELETIWMFRYHTWRGYPGGMNLTFPGNDDYKIFGKIGGRIGIRKMTFDQMSRGGVASGRIAVESGQLDGLRTPEHQSAAGRIGGRKRTEWAKRNPEQASKAGRLGGLITGPIQSRKNVESGHIQALGRANAKSGHLDYTRHVRWHATRNLLNPNCKFCKEI